MKTMGQNMINDEFYEDCQITMTLDDALEYKENVMLNGLPGTGKTAITKSWLAHNKDKVNGYWIDCPLMRKCIGKELVKNGLRLIGQVFSNDEIDKMASTPNLVVVVDNYQYISKEQETHIYLLCYGFVVDGREESGFKKIYILEFVCSIKTEEI